MAAPRRDKATDAATKALLPPQSQVLAWVAERWPERVDPERRAMELGEEAGEVLGAVIKLYDGDGRKTVGDVEMETAQVVICAMGLAESMGFDLWRAVAAEWERVCPTVRAAASALDDKPE